jgi:peroxin-12
MNGADYQAIDALNITPAEKLKRGHAPGWTSMLSPRELGPRILSGLSVALPMSIFALKFLEWWYQSDFAKQLSRKAAENIELPPPVLTSPKNKLNKKVEKKEDENGEPSAENAPVASPSMLPIYTVGSPDDSSLCPICREDIVTPTACQTGVVYCYTCIHRWIEGMHPMQEGFMENRDGKWESGQGRCAVTGRRVLGGTEGLRRIMV